MEFLLLTLIASLQGVSTAAPSTGYLRLQNGPDRCAGRVEIFTRNKWGTICDDDWDLADATVVCRELNCGTALRALQEAFFGLGTGPIWLESVKCTGKESRLANCKHPGFGRHNCEHYEDASVVCSDSTANLDGGFLLDFDDRKKEDERLLESTKATTMPTTRATTRATAMPTRSTRITATTPTTRTTAMPTAEPTVLGSVRLVNGEGRCAGRVEVFYNDTWGTVCDDLWGIDDAAVVCKQLKCGHPISANEKAFFGDGTGPIWLDNVRCNGSEVALGECDSLPWGKHDCKHEEDAGVVCSDHLNTKTPPLGENMATTRDKNNVSDISKPLSSETSDHIPIPSEKPGHNTLMEELAEAGSVRLVNGGGRCAGRVEVFYNDTWGTVCDDLWSIDDAAVVCKQLKCGHPISANEKAFFGAGTGPIWLDNVRCNGSEVALGECDSFPWGKHDCKHEEDAGVVCSSNLDAIPFTTEEDDRNTLKTTTDASLPVSGTVQTSPQFPILPEKPTHTGLIDDLTEVGSVRLVNGGGQCAGLVEVFYNDAWGTVCDDLWTMENAQVICRQLNCGDAISMNGNGFSGTGTGPIWLDNVRCNGNEKALKDCDSSPWGQYECNHEEGAGVVCSGNLNAAQLTTSKDTTSTIDRTTLDTHTDPSLPVSERVERSDHFPISPEKPSQIILIDDLTEVGSVRLVNGGGQCAGLVEVFYNDAWGTVCDDLWTMENAQVICRQLNCGDAISMNGNGFSGTGTGPIWLDNVRCNGNEKALKDCDSSPWGQYECNHDVGAGVICSGNLNAEHFTTSKDMTAAIDRTTLVTHTDPTLPVSERVESSDHFPISPEKPSQITLIDELTEVGSVRLVNGGGRCAGRVEVFYSDAWGTVCDDLWSMENAQVICRQLNCGDAISMNGNGFSGAGTGPIWLDNVKCNGNEKALKDCDSSPWGLYECNHEEGAGVVCSGNLNAGPLTTREDMIASNDRNTLHMHTTPSLPVSVHLEKWTDELTEVGSVRLVNGGSRCAGRVEVLYKDTWGTVCDDLWTMENARVICKQLKCGDAVSAKTKAFFGAGSGAIWLDNVRCKGSEEALMDCDSSSWGEHDCNHKEDAGIICSGAKKHQPPSAWPHTYSEPHVDLVNTSQPDSALESELLKSTLPSPFQSPLPEKYKFSTVHSDSAKDQHQNYHSTLPPDTVSHPHLEQFRHQHSQNTSNPPSHPFTHPGAVDTNTPHSEIFTETDQGNTSIAGKPHLDTFSSPSPNFFGTPGTDTSKGPLLDHTTQMEHDRATPTQPQREDKINSSRTEEKQCNRGLPEGTQQQSDCFCKVQMIACESHQYPELIQVLKEMRSDFSSFSSAFQEEKADFRSIASNLEQLTSAVQQLSVSLQLMLSHSNTGVGLFRGPASDKGFHKARDV